MEKRGNLHYMSCAMLGEIRRYNKPIIHVLCKVYMTGIKPVCLAKYSLRYLET